MASEQLALGDPIVNSIGMVLVPIPAGEFQMGRPDSDKDKAEGWKKATPQHLVNITKPYYLSICEVTQQQYEKVMGKRPWQDKPLVQEGPDYPATYVNWDDAAEFCRKLTDNEGVEYRLPTEAEWEYACRAGSMTSYGFGDDRSELKNYAWYKENAYSAGEQYAHRVARKLPNSWGLFDMHGNVWEWCQDWYAPYDAQRTNVSDPTGPENGRHRVWRGGAFSDPAEIVQSETRLSYGREGYRPEFLGGFRVARNTVTGASTDEKEQK